MKRGRVFLGVSGVGFIAALAVLLWLVFYRPDIAVLAFNRVYARLNRVEKVTPTTFRRTPDDTPYDRWVAGASERIPVFEGVFIDDVRTVALHPWPEMGEGVNGLYLRFADYQITDGRLLEIPSRGTTHATRHLFEMGVYVLGGPGHTIFAQEGVAPQRIDWQRGSLFSVPLNVSFQHFNDGGEPVRLLAVTSFPFVLNTTNSEDFIRDNPHVFRDRYDGEPDYFKTSRQVGPNLTVTHFVADVTEYPLGWQEYKATGAKQMRFDMAGNVNLSFHASELPPRTHKRAHRHSSDAFLLALSGQGYSVVWPEGGFDRRVRVEWHEGTLFVPPVYWYHQHFNPGSQPARQVVINAPHLVRRLGLRLEDHLEENLPEIAEEWKRALAGG